MVTLRSVLAAPRPPRPHSPEPVMLMPRWPVRMLLLSTVALMVRPHGLLAADPAAPGATKVVFETDIAPILEARCVKCHGHGQTKAGLDLRRKFAMLKGGDSGPALAPGKPGESLLIQRVEKGEMPPPEEGRLDE